MTFFDAIVLGIVEGLTEFLPVSSTGHLTIVEKMLGLQINNKGITGFTAVIQTGAIVAVLLYFRRDIVDIVVTWFRGIRHAEVRGEIDYRLGWYVIVGSIPVVVAGLAAKSLVTGPLRNLWWVASALVVWSAVMVVAERRATQARNETDLNLTDAILVGVVQCVSLVPGVSRSGATISTGLLRGLDRVTATRLSFFLSIPALVGAGIYELPSAISDQSHISVTYTITSTVVSFLVAYVSIAWLLRFVAHHSIAWFVPYRVLLGGAILVLLAANVISAT
jgi:undecaprenyl-diphosphatase